MTELQRYLADEIAEEHADGLVSRREALRRLGLLGLGGAAAASLLAGFLADEARARMRGASGSGATGPSAGDIAVAARPTREIVRGPGGRKLMGAWAAAARPRGGVLVIHENRGLNDSIRRSPAAWPRAATRRWRSTCCRKRAGPGRSRTSSRRWQRWERS